MARGMILTAVLCLAVLAADDVAVAPREATSLKPQAPSLEMDAITIPQMLSYQGKLVDTFGLPVVDTAYSVNFRLYSVSSGGSPFWNETQTVRTRSGLFSTLLGSATPIGSMPDAGAAYLGMAVEGGPELAPRLRIVSAAYAYKADSAGYAAAAAPVGVAGGDLTGTYPDPTIDNGAVTTPKIYNLAVTDAKLADGAVTAAKLSQMGAATGQVIKWTGSQWAPGNDSVGVGGGGTVTSVSHSTGITCSPNPITTTGTVRLNTSYSDGRYVNATGDSITGALAIGAPLRVHDKAALGYSCNNNGFAAFCAGYGNSASGDHSSITGGEDNSADGKYSHIGGGSENQASALWATIGGGNVNEAADSAATISGGRSNYANAAYATVGGGSGNSAVDRYTTVGGGYNNTASGQGAMVGGGYSNEASGAGAAVGGGQNNDASGTSATAGGGQSNHAAELCAAVGGGQGNDASGSFSVIPGGRNNRARGYLSFAAGTRAHANHHACFVWGDSTQSVSESVYTTGSNQWRVRARGGVWFYSNLAMTAGVYLAPSSNSWTGISYQKDGSAVPVDRHALLERLVTVPVREYRLDGQDESVRHIGPTAHEYCAALGYGETETGINLVDADGVTLAAIQALYEQNQTLYERVEAQQEQIDQLNAELKRR